MVGKKRAHVISMSWAPSATSATLGRLRPKTFPEDVLTSKEVDANVPFTAFVARCHLPSPNPIQDHVFPCVKERTWAVDQDSLHWLELSKQLACKIVQAHGFLWTAKTFSQNSGLLKKLPVVLLKKKKKVLIKMPQSINHLKNLFTFGWQCRCIQYRWRSCLISLHFASWFSPYVKDHDYNLTQKYLQQVMHFLCL